MDPDEEQITDGELVSSSKATQVSGGEILMNMEGLIKNYIASIDKLEDEAKKHKEMLDDIFENDTTFKQHSDEAKEAAQKKQKTKAEILKRPQAAELNEKIKSMKSQISEQQNSLSDYLQQYAQMAGVNEIEVEDGSIREIVYTAKLVRKSEYRP